jgi:seryl-tRNA synthetase
LFHDRKRTKKQAAARPGRPKKAKTDEGTSGQSSPRTRAAAAKEAAARAAKEAQLATSAAEAAAIAEAAAAAEALASKQARAKESKQARAAAKEATAQAAEEAAQAEEAAAEDLLDVPPLATEHVPTGSPQTPPRASNLELQIVNQLEQANAAPTKFTPRKKLATKVKKAPTKMKSPAKKGKK